MLELVAVLLVIAVVAAWLLPAPVGWVVAGIAVVAALLIALRRYRGRV